MAENNKTGTEIPKLVIGVLGNYRAGKSYTWHTLFGKEVRTGKHPRNIIIHNQKIPVFLINGAPLDRGVELKYIMPKTDPEIVLCSFLYHRDVKENFNYFFDKNYQMYVQWLNPGYEDENDKVLFYNTGIINYLMSKGAVIAVKNGKINPKERVNEIRNYLYSWYLENYPADLTHGQEK